MANVNELDKEDSFTVGRYEGRFNIEALNRASYDAFLRTPPESAIRIFEGVRRPDFAISVGEVFHDWSPTNILKKTLPVRVSGRAEIRPYVLKINMDLLWVDPESEASTEPGSKCRSFMDSYVSSMAGFFSGSGHFWPYPVGGVWRTHVYVRLVRKIDVRRYGDTKGMRAATLLMVVVPTTTWRRGVAGLGGVIAYVCPDDIGSMGQVAAHETGHLLGLGHLGMSDWCETAGKESPDIVKFFSDLGSSLRWNIMCAGGGFLGQTDIGTPDPIHGIQFGRVLEKYLKGDLQGARKLDQTDLFSDFPRHQLPDGKGIRFPSNVGGFDTGNHVLPYLIRMASDNRWSIRSRGEAGPEAIPTVHVGLSESGGLEPPVEVHNQSSPVDHLNGAVPEEKV